MTALEQHAFKTWARALDTLGVGPKPPSHWPERASAVRQVYPPEATPRRPAIRP